MLHSLHDRHVMFCGTDGVRVKFYIVLSHGINVHLSRQSPFYSTFACTVQGRVDSDSIQSHDSICIICDGMNPVNYLVNAAVANGLPGRFTHSAQTGSHIRDLPIIFYIFIGSVI